MTNGGWDEWRNLVLDKLEEHSEFHQKHLEETHKLRIELAELRLKAGVWGALAGVLPALGVGLLYVIFK